MNNTQFTCVSFGRQVEPKAIIADQLCSLIDERDALYLYFYFGPLGTDCLRQLTGLTIGDAILQREPRCVPREQLPARTAKKKQITARHGRKRCGGASSSRLWARLGFGRSLQWRSKRGAPIVWVAWLAAYARCAYKRGRFSTSFDAAVSLKAKTSRSSIAHMGYTLI